MSDTQLPPIVDDEPMHIDGIEFRLGFGAGSTSTQFWIRKHRELVESYRTMLPEFAAGNIVELGIHDGGSTALLALVAHARKIVAIDLTPERLPHLDDFRRERGLVEVLRPHFGIDQADRPRLSQLLDDEFGDAPLDLVIDDASHLYDPTVASFELLFPRLRPGGLYIVEDWAWEYQAWDQTTANDGNDGMVDALVEALPRPGGRRALVTLALQLCLARASFRTAIGDVAITSTWVAVRRGPAPLDPDTFSIDDLVTDHVGLLSSNEPRKAI